MNTLNDVAVGQELYGVKYNIKHTAYLGPYPVTAATKTQVTITRPDGALVRISRSTGREVGDGKGTTWEIAHTSTRYELRTPEFDQEVMLSRAHVRAVNNYRALAHELIELLGTTERAHPDVMGAALPTLREALAALKTNLAHDAKAQGSID